MVKPLFYTNSGENQIVGRNISIGGISLVIKSLVGKYSELGSHKM